MSANPQGTSRLYRPIPFASVSCKSRRRSAPLHRWTPRICRGRGLGALILTPLVLGVDASLTRTAIASAGGDGHRHLAIQTSSGTPIERRLRYLADAVYEAVTRWPGGPATLLVMETPGFVQRKGSMEGIYRAQGAILAGLPDSLRVEVVPVHVWRHDLGIPFLKGDSKGPTIAWVEQQGIVLPYSPRSREPDHDVADGYALALYGQMRLRAGRLAPLGAR